MTEAALIAAGAVQDLPPGGRKLVFVPGGETVLVLNVEGEFYALENSCPHAGASLASGACEGRVIACPAVIEMLLDEESPHLAGLSDFIGKPISLQAEATMNPEQYDIVLM